MDTVAIWLGYGVLAALAVLIMWVIVEELYAVATALDLVAFCLIHGRKKDHVWTWRDTLCAPRFAWQQYIWIRTAWGDPSASNQWGTWNGFRKWRKWDVPNPR